MSRRRRAERREVLPDAKFGDTVLTRFMNALMYDGKKSAAEGIVYGALEVIERRAKADPVKLFHEALDNVKPAVEVRSRRVGGATYQVPVEVPARRARTLAVRWLVDFARARNEYSMSERLANEILDATRQQGNAWKRKDDIFRMAQANKAFAHYRW
jgi:small subunit ribosomal protein S7